MSTQFLDIIPAPVLFLILLALFIVMLELGYKLGDRHQRATEYVAEGRSSQAGVVLGAMFTMSSLLLGFTFSMAGGQFDSRRLLVIEDVNAIGTAFLRTQSLPEPQRSNSRQLFAQYVTGREYLFDKEATAAEMQASLELQSALWAEVRDLSRDAPTPVVSIYLQALNAVFDLHTKRLSVQEFVRIPDLIIATLALLSMITMLLTGYLLGLRQRRYGLPTALMILTYATVYLLVIDLDRPRRGMFQVPQQPMIELQQSIRTDINAAQGLPPSMNSISSPAQR